MVAGLAFRNLYREGAPSLHAILLTADVFGVTYPPGTRLCSSPFADRRTMFAFPRSASLFRRITHLGHARRLAAPPDK